VDGSTFTKGKALKTVEISMMNALHRTFLKLRTKLLERADEPKHSKERN
jgi:hypothetical protein